MNFSKNTLTLILGLTFIVAKGQYEIIPAEGYTPQIGTMVDMLEEIKNRIEEETLELDSVKTDYLFDDQANSIGQLIMHLVANELYYQSETLEIRSWTEEEINLFSRASDLADESKNQLKGKPAKYYLDLWDQVRKKTLEGLKTKDDIWFSEAIEEGLNNHYVWFHVMEHSVGHLGQIVVVKKRLPK